MTAVALPREAEDDKHQHRRGSKHQATPVVHEYDLDGDAIFEIVERNAVDELHAKFGGLAGLCDRLKSDATNGVASSSIPGRVEQFGVNELEQKEPVTYWEMLVDALGDSVIQILSVAAAISIFFGEFLPNPHSGIVEVSTGWIEGTAILISVVVVVMVGSINNYQKAKKFEEMERAQSVKKVTVTRDGKNTTIQSDAIVVGDILHLEPGMELPCDGVYASGYQIKCNESPITGEPDLIEKDAERPIFISGTAIEEGTGTMLVIAIGMSSYQGRLKDMKDDEKPGNRANADSHDGGDGDGKKPGADASSDDRGDVVGVGVTPAAASDLHGASDSGSSVPLQEMSPSAQLHVPASDSDRDDHHHHHHHHHSTHQTPAAATKRHDDADRARASKDKNTDNEDKKSENGSGSGSDSGDDDDDGDETPLQQHLSDLADKIGQFGLYGALALVAALFIKEGILIAQFGKVASAASFLGYIIVAITLIAVAIPEGLPLAVTIALAFAMKAMMDDQCMVRVLASCETMGAATAICSDKTGTLTTNQMTVVQGVICETEFVLDGYQLQKRSDSVRVTDRTKFTVDIAPGNLDLVARALSLNSTARQQRNEETDQLEWVGNKTEIGLLGAVKLFGFDYQSYRQLLPEGATYVYNFTSERKKMTTLIRDPTTGGLVAFVKGASEMVLQTCTRYVASDGSVQILSDTMRSFYGTVIEDMANQGNRTICVAYAPCEFTEFPKEHPELADYIMLGILGIQDPIRPEVPDAVKACGSAGLVVRMVTGDNINTAMAIGRKCGIYKDTTDIAMEGPAFRELYRTDEKRLLELLPKMRVLARSSPKDKYILVKLLQSQDGLGDVVGVTGDGTNDAPALKLADVGFAMKSGTDIAKGAADMVLLDDNFATVVTAIKWGRAVNDNIKKFLQYQLAINFAGVALTLVGSLASATSKEPISPVQLLWLNLIMDTLAALSLATELPEDASLSREPVYKEANLITNRMWTFIGIHGAYQFTIVMLLLFLGHKWFDTVEYPDTCARTFNTTMVNGTFTDSTLQWCNMQCTPSGGILDTSTMICQQGPTHSTIIFNAFIFCQVFNVINSRKIYGEHNPFEGTFSRSQNLLIIFAIITALQAIAVEYFAGFMDTIGLSWQMWLITVGFGAFELILGVFVRALPVKDDVPDAAAEKAARERDRHKQIEGPGASGHADTSSAVGFVARLGTDPSLKRSNSIIKRRPSVSSTKSH